MKVSKIGEAFGAEISGIDLSRPIGQDEFTDMRAAWLEHLVLRFRRQQLSDPEVNVISNIKVDGQPIGGLGDGEAIWHADMTYVERPPMAAMLHALEIPPSGGIPIGPTCTPLTKRWCRS